MSTKAIDRRSGLGLIEAMIGISLLAVAVMATFSLLDSSRRFASASLEIGAMEDLGQHLIYDIERELSGAAIVTPSAALTTSLSIGDTDSVELASNAGFPPVGWAVLDRGTPTEEVLRYGTISADGRKLVGLTRGQACTPDANHALGPIDVLWRGLAELIDDQTNPPAGAFDGASFGETGLEYFRGQGTGLVFQIPVDPDGDGSVMNEEGVQWGASLREFGPTENGYTAIYYEPRDTYEEARFDVDVNNDGDTEDTFDIGQLRRVVWDANNPGRVEDIGIGPTAILQESCAWGSDLDNNGSSDPIFLINEERRTVHVRLHIIGRSDPRRPILRTVESVLFLRNDPDA